MDTAEILQQAATDFSRLDDGELLAAGVYERDAFFVPIVAYPAMSFMPPASAEDLLAPHRRLRGPAAIYVHVPFCITRCLFCHWVIKLDSDDDEVSRYLRCLDREFTLYREHFGGGKIQASSILIGGGTPSLLNPGQMEKFLQILHNHLDLSTCRQFSYEAEPSTLLGEVGATRLALLKQYGVQRISMGVQAFDDHLLKANARHHNSAQALEAIHLIKDQDISSSIDLIYGLNGQSLESWVSTLKTALSSGADAWQLYRLRIVPHGDKPGKVVDHYRKNPSRYAHIDDAYVMKMVGINMSEAAGFHQHYTRIFARGRAHISEYLYDVNHGLTDVVGVGISSWGNLGNTYLLNVGDNFPKYYEMIESGHLPIDRGMVRDADIDARHHFILQLKNTRVEKTQFLAHFGISVADKFGPTLAWLKGLHLLEENDECLWLTPRGRFFADQISIHFCAPEHRPRAKRPDLPPQLPQLQPSV